ncbi:MAG TPA: tetratricopeptide repeat protein [Pseudonocardiaceae bacterium]|nr:tetratricopeptide repeat protein [Pseudonocardiaceae bacterium]
MATQFRLLGNIEVRVDGQSVPVGYAQLRAVLAVLLVEVNRVVPVEVLVDRVWGTRALPKRPRSGVQHDVTLLRRTLAAIPHTGITWAAPGYRLTADPTTIDLHEFHRLSDEARASDDDERAIALFTEALRHWGGEPFAGTDTPWFDTTRATLTRQYHAARHDLNDLRLRDGQHGALIPELFDLTRQQPLDERLAGQYVLALYRSGRQAEALAHYRHVQRLLAEELGTDPSPPLQQLHQRILTADRTLAAGGRPTPDPAAATAMFSMRADIPTFTGRDAELHVLLDTVLATLDGPVDDRGGVRAIAIHTVDGMPGVGKTAFSVHVAHRLADRFPDGNIFLDLRGHTPGQQPLTAGAALESLLRAAGVDPKQIPPSLEDRARLWRDRLAGKKVLLVLDDAVDHEQIRPLLPGTAGNLVLITSRRRLAALDGVTPLTLDVFSPDQALALLARLSGRTADPGGHDHAGMARVVACCGYLSLAIAIAGAQLRSHPTWSTTYLADLLAIEHERLEHLDVGDRSVRAAFDMSFSHRPTTQQLLFRLLGVHPGPDIDAYATAALADCSVRDARQGLAGLHADHMIEEAAAGRYRLHDLLRVYASTLAADLDPDDRRDAMDRALTYYQYTVRQANTQLPESHTSPLPPITTAPMPAPSMDNPSTARSWLAAELPTLIACVLHAGSTTPAAGHLATALHPFLRASGYIEHAMDIHRTALTAARDSNDQVGQANALTDLGDIQHFRGEYAGATDDLTRALDLYTAMGNGLGQANALVNLGRVQCSQGEHAAASDSLTRAFDLYTTIGNRPGQAKALVNLGDMQYLTAKWAEATDTLTRALDLYTAMGNRLGQANARTYLSFMQYQQGQYAAATDNLTRALELFTAVGNRVGRANALANLGRVQYSQGEYAAASDSLTGALDLFTVMGNRVGQINTLTNLGRVRSAQGDYGAATDSLTRALDLSTGTPLNQANALTNLGIVQRLRGEYGTAKENLVRALDLFAVVHDADGEAETLNNLGDLALDHPEAGDPSTYFGRALTIARNIGATKHEAHAMAGQARCLLPTADPTQAIELLRKAHSLYLTLGVPEAIEVETMLSTLDDQAEMGVSG